MVLQGSRNCVGASTVNFSNIRSMYEFRASVSSASTVRYPSAGSRRIEVDLLQIKGIRGIRAGNELTLDEAAVGRSEEDERGQCPDWRHRPAKFFALL